MSRRALLVVGVLQADRMQAALRVEEVLFGQCPDAVLPVSCERPGRQAGSERIWDLSLEADGLWHAGHPALAIEERPRVERDIQGRLSAFREVLEGMGEERDRRRAMEALIEAGPAAVPVVWEYLTAAQPDQHALGWEMLTRLLEEERLAGHAGSGD
jgi:hypothetical protein